MSTKEDHPIAVVKDIGDTAVINEASRQKELTTFEDMQVYEWGPANIYRQTPDAILVSTTWVETVNAEGETKSRLCAREFNNSKGEDLYAATLPLLATRLMLSQCATRKSGWPMKQLMSIDVKRAFLHGETKRAIFVKLLPEVCAPVRMIWELKKTMYVTRDALQVWRREVHKMLIARDFKNSKASPCFYYHEARDMNVITHVDDFLRAGTEKA